MLRSLMPRSRIGRPHAAPPHRPDGIVCVYERKQAYLLRDLQEMRKRVEAVAVTVVDGTLAEAAPSTKGKDGKRGGTALKKGKATVA
jgi:hypothetical protein